MSTKICPRCGSVKVEKVGRRYRCLEDDCLHEAEAQEFNKGGPGQSRQPNQHWRDPVAMTPEGYEE